MQQSDRILLDFVIEIDLAIDLDTLFGALERAALDLGFDSVSYTYIPSVIGNAFQQFSPVFKTSKSYNTKFIEHYVANNFAEKDFTIKRIKGRSLTPISWWQEADNKTISREEKRVIEVARADYGLRHGISIPTYSDGENMAGVSVTNADPDYQFSLLYTEKMETMCRIARIFSDRVLVMPRSRACFLLPLLEEMSPTEKQILKNLALGKALKAIAADLGISYRYAGNVIERLRSKLGNISRDQLLYVAGLIEFHTLVN